MVKLGCVPGCIGRALEWHSRGKGFDPPHLHQLHLGRTPVFLARALPCGCSSENESAPIRMIRTGAFSFCSGRRLFLLLIFRVLFQPFGVVLPAFFAFVEFPDLRHKEHRVFFQKVFRQLQHGACVPKELFQPLPKRV